MQILIVTIVFIKVRTVFTNVLEFIPQDFRPGMEEKAIDIKRE